MFKVVVYVLAAYVALKVLQENCGIDILGKIEGIQPGETAELVINDLPAGTYAFIWGKGRYGIPYYF